MTEQHETESTATIARKLAEVIGAVDTIPETGYNSFHKYKYVTEADLLRAIRNELSKRSVCFVPQIVKSEREVFENDRGKRTVNVRMLVAFRFIDGESGESIVVGPFWGEGEDSNDKAGYKAHTGALKYCLRQTFMVPTGEDPERDSRESNSSSKSRQSSGSNSAPAPTEPEPDWQAENKRFRALTSAHPKRAHEAMKRMVDVDSFRDVAARNLKSFNDRLSKVAESERAVAVDEWCKKFNVGEGWEPEPDPATAPGAFRDDEIPF